jgi:hypothetical protein
MPACWQQAADGSADAISSDDSEEISGSDDKTSGYDSHAPSSPDGSAWSFSGTDGTNRSPIIPRTAWAVHVGNTPYAGSPALVTPCPQGATTTVDQQNNRIAALRNILGESSGVTVDELQTALEGMRWDLGAA